MTSTLEIGAGWKRDVVPARPRLKRGRGRRHDGTSRAAGAGRCRRPSNGGRVIAAQKGQEGQVNPDMMPLEMYERGEGWKVFEVEGS